MFFLITLLKSEISVEISVVWVKSFYLAVHADKIQMYLNIFPFNWMWIERTAVAQFRALSAFSSFHGLSFIFQLVWAFSVDANWSRKQVFRWQGWTGWLQVTVPQLVSLTQDILYILHRRGVAAPASRAHADRFNQGLVTNRPLGFWVNSTAPMLVCLKCGTIHRGAPGSIDTVCWSAADCSE